METLKNIGDIVDLGISFGSFFFRGHQQIIEDKPLVPKVFRGFEAAHEEYYINEFIRYARGYVQDFPTDKSSILFLMQHYGLPTRLLDWSTNIFVAAYFAVSGTLEKDGEIWVLNPEKLNRLATKEKDYLTIVSSFIDEPFINKKDRNDDNKKHIEVPIVIKPNHFDKRMIAQQSVFTIHSNNSKNISELGLNSRDIERFRIPSDMKSVLRRHLFDLGTSERILYPDIEGLTRDIYQNKNIRIMNQVHGYPIKSIITK